MTTITIDDIAVTAREVADTGDWLGRGAALLNDIAARVKIEALRNLVKLGEHESQIAEAVEALDAIVQAIPDEDTRLFTMPDVLRRAAERAQSDASFVMAAFVQLDNDGECLLDAWDAAVDGVAAAAEGDLDADSYDSLGDSFAVIAEAWGRVIG